MIPITSFRFKFIHLSPKKILFFQKKFIGGAGRSRTDLHGFAIRCITALLPRQSFEKKRKLTLPFFQNGAGDESRTRDLNLGKVALYQLSYSRVDINYNLLLCFLHQHLTNIF